MYKEQHHAMELFGELLKNYHIIVNKELNKYGLYKGQPFILQFLKEHPGITQKELAQEMRVTKSTIGASIRRMERMGFLERSQDPEDSRCNQIVITQKGLKALEDCEKDIKRVMEALYSKIPEEEEDLVINVLKKLLEGLNSFREQEKL